MSTTVGRVRVMWLGALVLSACASSNTSSTSTASSASPSGGPPCHNPHRELYLAASAVGSPDASSQQFLDDQDGKYNSAQFSNPNFYPPGYHWKIDRAFAPSDVISVRPLTEPDGLLHAQVTLNAEGAAQLQLLTTHAAAAESPGSPASQIAVFVGQDVVFDPVVTLPDRSNVLDVEFSDYSAGSSSAAQLLSDIC